QIADTPDPSPRPVSSLRRRGPADGACRGLHAGTRPAAVRSGRDTTMPTKRKAPQPLADVRRSVEHLRAEGERLADRIRRDARTLLARGRTEILKDTRRFRTEVGTRATHALHQLETRVRRQLRAATTERVAALEK